MAAEPRQRQSQLVGQFTRESLHFGDDPRGSIAADLTTLEIAA